MNNNDIFKKLRVALQLRDDQIVSILELVDFRISKAELGAFFRADDHPNFVLCGDQVLRIFLNGLVIYLRGTKEAPKNPMDVIASHKVAISKNATAPKSKPSEPTVAKKKPVASEAKKKYPDFKKDAKGKKPEVVEKVRYKNGKK
jgi:hypothetical protein